MLIWINGGFGSGKTQTAYELARRLPHAFVYDPEEAGFFIRDNMPKEMGKADFQDFPAWRHINEVMLRSILTSYKGVIICPMTVTNKSYLDEMIQPLLESGVEIQHYLLNVSKETLYRRLKGRGERHGSWCFEQIERCVTAFEDDAFETKLQTDELSISEVVEKIASLSGLTLLEDKRHFLQVKSDRFKIWLKHIRAW